MKETACHDADSQTYCDTCGWDCDNGREEEFWATEAEEIARLQAIAARQPRKAAGPNCLPTIRTAEEIAFEQEWIDAKAVEAEADSMGKSAYAAYLRDVLRRHGR